MINSVRNTVLSVLNKNNYGYLSPSDFNLFAKQAQLEVFEEYFREYNALIDKENKRYVLSNVASYSSSGVDYADMRRNMEENLEVFYRVDNLQHISGNVYSMPTIPSTGYDYFFVNKILCYDVSGLNPIYLGEAEKVSNGRITLLVNSNLTAPTTKYPAYTIQGDQLTVYPSTLNVQDAVECHYFRYPKDPKWTYITLGGGAPIFDQTQSDYQDFEVRPEDEVTLVIKILAYAGVSIREADVYVFAKKEETEQEAQK
ncbi:structural protein [Caudoviricetes sp.]|nr:structural protein [Caudoviricetes sp.]